MVANLCPPYTIILANNFASIKAFVLSTTIILFNDSSSICLFLLSKHFYFLESDCSAKLL